MSDFAERFMRQLKELERQRDVEPLRALFAQDAELSRAPRDARYRGTDGVGTFWSEYLDAFEHIETEFDKVIEGSEGVVLEWHTHATTHQGREIQYAGCSVLEVEDGRVRRFRTYYDAESAGSGSALRQPRQPSADA